MNSTLAKSFVRLGTFALLLTMANQVKTEEPYTVTIDDTDIWTGTNVTNFLNADSSVSSEPTAVQLQVNTTTGSVNGAVAYLATNPNGDPEINVNIAAQDAQQAILTWTFSSGILPLGVNNPSMTLRDVDSNVNGVLETPAGSSNEFCDRLEIRAFDINNLPVPASSFSVATGTGPTTFSEVPPSAGTPANSFVIEGTSNNGPGTPEAIVSVNANSVGSIVMIYEQCEDPDTDRPGALGIVNGLDGFSIFTTDLTLRKQWVDAAVNDTATVSVSGGTITVNDLDSTANAAAEIDSGVATEVISGVDYTISETLGAANGRTYDSSLSCTGSGDTDVADGVLTPSASDTNVICTYLNDARVADVSVTKTDSTSTYTPGAAFSYVIRVDNNGPDTVDGLVVTDTLPTAMARASWNCSASGGALCPNANGTGSISETISVFPNGGQIIYTVTGNYPASPAGY
ncbi:DUF11 domain-containing protein [Kangiella sp. TOML190]|uniref:DUF11 domain-containing protein n=1 Tax=Kangiella sp. TOML190 TaxID=2931351 RepID=UPI00203AAF4C|nr:DUF11 domain-containing protein [Kangiella sp. TOML190]